ncbi:UDP-glucose pyrophosphorylase [Seinonella peptonophila]|uniref:UTP--glucose-1-phosphate uridylyltransferase n=1 Tax=Seinonella peptonophila TaxID=112248 RepID=A0A1M5AHU4_9BACL|nr:sugar phosphate nucleotidyltransferase [Seinonella peptonophila]SHF29684.1 UDP-glucose pyrophosphorylase [Seinonella peptonophila]
MQASVNQAVILAYRLSLSYLPSSKVIAKEMLPILHKPVIQWIVEELEQAGIEQILIIAGFQKQQIEDHFTRHLEWETLLTSEKAFRKKDELDKLKQRSIQVIRYRENGTGHPLLEAATWIRDEPFLLVESEHLISPCHPYPTSSKQLLRQHEEWGCSLIGIHTPTTDHTGEGIWLHSSETQISPGETAPIVTVGRKQGENTFVSAGRYILQSSVFEQIRQSKDELTLIEILQQYNQQQPMLAYHFYGEHAPLYSPTDLFRANLIYAELDPLYREMLNRWIEKHVVT